MFFNVYIVRCSDGTYYTGLARDLERRMRAHNNGKASKYTRGRLPVELVYWESCATRGQAASRECEIKRWSRAKKQALIDGKMAGARAPQTPGR